MVKVWAAWENTVMKTKKMIAVCLMMGFAVSNVEAVYLFGDRPQAKGEQMIYSHIEVNKVYNVENQQLKGQHKGQHFPLKVYIVDCQRLKGQH